MCRHISIGIPEVIFMTNVSSTSKIGQPTKGVLSPLVGKNFKEDTA